MRNSYSEIRKYRYSVHSGPIVLIADDGEKKTVYSSPNICVAKQDPIPRKWWMSLYPHEKFIIRRRMLAQKREGERKKCNTKILCKLKYAKGSDCALTNSDDYRPKQSDIFRVPDHTVNRFREVIGTTDKKMILKLFRPKIYLDMEIRNTSALGRLHIQLFTEACPAVVLAFMSTCAGNNASRFNFARILGGFWIEGEFKSDSEEITEGGFTHDMNAIDHGLRGGILSFAKCYLEGFKSGIINFSISFKPLDILNGERVAFGIVSQGIHILDRLQNYNVATGSTKYYEIVVSECGLF